MKTFIPLTVLAFVLSTGFASSASTQSRVQDLQEDAITSLENGDFKQAKEYLSEAFELEPKNENLGVLLIYVSNMAGDHDRAIGVGIYVIEKLNKKNSVALREIGFAFAMKASEARKAGDLDKSKELGEYATGLLFKSLELKLTDKITWDILIAHFEVTGEKELAAKARKTRDDLNIDRID